MDFDKPPVKNAIIMLLHNLMVNRPEEFLTYESLEAYVRNHMINETTKFFACNRNELENIYKNYKKGLKDVS